MVEKVKTCRNMKYVQTYKDFKSWSKKGKRKYKNKILMKCKNYKKKKLI